MLLPSIFGNGFLSDGFDDDFDDFMTWPDESKMMKPLYGKNAARMMKTDVRDVDGNYEVDIDLPGFNKEELSVSLNDGYLTISAQKGLEKDDKDKKGKFVRHERYSGSMERSFYIGEDYKDEDIKAKYENGILRLTLPKHDEKTQVEDHTSRIAIEG